jgi:hypothetical protein
MMSKFTSPSSRAVDGAQKVTGHCEQDTRCQVETTVENSRKLRMYIIAVMGYIV